MGERKSDSKDFKLQNCNESSADFSARHKDVFSFDEIKIKSSSREFEEKNEKRDEPSTSKQDLHSFKGKQSLFREEHSEKFDVRKLKNKREFKKPYDTSKARHNNKRFKTPDFRKNPQKYTKYSLKDVDLMNNRSNSQAAFDFLREIDERKQKQDDSDHRDIKEGQKIEFKKPAKDKDESAKKVTKKSQRPQMALSHLMGDEEDD